MKDTRQAKTRLGGTQAERRQFAIVMMRDTLCAVVSTSAVDGVVVVAQERRDRGSLLLPGIRVMVQTGSGLNDAIRAGMDVVRSAEGNRDIAVLPGDLPYLRSSELESALQHASAHPLSVVGDRRGTGTTLLTAASGAIVEPAYGPQSLRRHREQGAVELGVPAWSGLRRDVDVMSDLASTDSLGRRTRMLLSDRAVSGASG